MKTQFYCQITEREEPNMGADTHGKIRGFVRHEDIFNFIVQKY